MSAKDPAERALIARLASNTYWATCPDPSAHTAPGRRAFLDRFERQVDPDGTLPPAERAKRAERAKVAYFSKLAHRSAQARKARLAKRNGVNDGGRDAAA